MIKRGEEDRSCSDIVDFEEWNFFFIKLEFDKTQYFDGSTLLTTILGKVKFDLFVLLDFSKTKLSSTLLLFDFLLFVLFLFRSSIVRDWIDSKTGETRMLVSESLVFWNCETNCFSFCNYNRVWAYFSIDLTPQKISVHQSAQESPFLFLPA